MSANHEGTSSQTPDPTQAPAPGERARKRSSVPPRPPNIAGGGARSRPPRRKQRRVAPIAARVRAGRLGDAYASDAPAPSPLYPGVAATLPRVASDRAAFARKTATRTCSARTTPTRNGAAWPSAEPARTTARACPPAEEQPRSHRNKCATGSNSRKRGRTYPATSELCARGRNTPGRPGTCPEAQWPSHPLPPQKSPPAPPSSTSSDPRLRRRSASSGLPNGSPAQKLRRAASSRRRGVRSAAGALPLLPHAPAGRPPRRPRVPPRLE